MKCPMLVIKNKSLKSLLALTGYFSVLLALFFVSDFVMAGGASGKSLGDVAGSITNSMSGVAKLITAASYVAGVGFALMGMLKFKAHKDQPAQVPLSQPIVLLCIAAGLVFLPSLLSTAGQTIWAGSQQNTTAAGTGIPGEGN